MSAILVRAPREGSLVHRVPLIHDGVQNGTPTVCGRARVRLGSSMVLPSGKIRRTRGWKILWYVDASPTCPACAS